MDITEAIKWLAEMKWGYLVFGFPLSVFVLMFYLKNKAIIATYFKAVVLWAKCSLETNGQASIEKIGACLITTFVLIPICFVAAYRITDNAHLIWLIAVICVFILLLLRIVLPQQILELKNSFSSNKQTNGPQP